MCDRDALDTTGKYAQDYPYDSPQRSTMTGRRNAVESYNGMLKEKDHEALEDGGRRRVRGFAKQALIVALMVFSANVRSIRTFMQGYHDKLSPSPTDPGPDCPTGRRDLDKPDSSADEPPPLRTAA